MSTQLEEIDEGDLQVWMRPKKEKGPSEYPHLNDELRAGIEKMADDLVYHIYQVDQQIEFFRDALRLLQPHGSGRMDLRYWKGKLPGRHPSPFLWKGLPRYHQMPLKKGERQNKNKSLTQRTSQKHVYSACRIANKGLLLRLKRKGKFRETLKHVKYVVKRIERLLAMREMHFEALRRWRISVTLGITKQHEEIMRMDAEARQLFPVWQAEFDKRYDELDERRRVHMVLLDEEDERRAKKGYQFGTMPTAKRAGGR